LIILLLAVCFTGAVAVSFGLVVGALIGEWAIAALNIGLGLGNALVARAVWRRR
jgi:hypothetical protein